MTATGSLPLAFRSLMKMSLDSMPQAVVSWRRAILSPRLSASGTMYLTCHVFKKPVVKQYFHCPLNRESRVAKVLTAGILFLSRMSATAAKVAVMVGPIMPTISGSAAHLAAATAGLGGAA